MSTAESNVVEVKIFWPEGGQSVWTSGTPIVSEDGVGPLSAGVLGALTGLLTGAGVLAPLDDERRHLISFVPREQLYRNLQEVLPSLDRMGRGDADTSGDRL